MCAFSCICWPQQTCHQVVWLVHFHAQASSKLSLASCILQPCSHQADLQFCRCKALLSLLPLSLPLHRFVFLCLCKALPVPLPLQGLHRKHCSNHTLQTLTQTVPCCLTWCLKPGLFFYSPASLLASSSAKIRDKEPQLALQILYGLCHVLSAGSSS